MRKSSASTTSSTAQNSPTVIWPFNRNKPTETGAEFYIRDAAMADAKAVIQFKHRMWRQMYADLKDDAFFEKAEATIPEQVQFWQSRINHGDKIWLAEDLRERIVGTIHAGTQQSDQTTIFAELYGLKGYAEIRFFYLDDPAAQTTVGQEFLVQAVGNKPAITWLSGTAPLVEANLHQAGFEPLGEPVEPSTEPWQGVPRQAMVRR